MSSPSSSCLLLMAKGSVMRPPRRAQMMMILANKSRPEGLLSVRSASGWVRRRLPSSTVVPQQEIRSNSFRYRGQGPCRFVHSGSKAITAETTAKSQQQQQQQQQRRQSSTETEPSALLSTNTASAIVVPPTSTDDSSAISSSTTTTATATTNQLSSSSSSSKLRSYSELAKARLSALVVSTTAAGYLSATAAGAGAGGVMLLSPTLVSCLAGTALCSSSAAAWNQIFEVDRDARMKRTATRPLVTGALSQSQAVSAATTWGVTGTAVLAAGTDPVTTALGMSNILLYAGLYTYLKPRSVTNTWVGAVVGAIPPVMGFTAATGGGGGVMMDAVVGAETAALLAATLYLWQMPHFFALSYMHRVDYKRGGFVMVPTVEPDGERHCAQLVVRYSWYLSAIPVVATAAEVTSSMFLLEGLVLNGYALAVAHRFERQRTNANARKVFLTSLWYLPSLLMLFLLHSKVWDEQAETVEDTTMAVVQKQQQESFLPSLRTYIHRIREKGRELCWHEALLVSSSTSNNSSSGCTAKDEDSSKNKTLVGAAAAAACPVVVGKETSRQAQLQVATAASAAVAVAADVTAESPQPVAVKLTPPSEQTTAQDSSSR